MGEWLTETPYQIPDLKYKTLGCWCYLPLAARLPFKRCWLDARGLPGGWNEPTIPSGLWYKSISSDSALRKWGIRLLLLGLRILTRRSR